MGFSQVAVEPGVQEALPVVLHRERGHGDDTDRRGSRFARRRSSAVTPSASGKLDVDEDEIGRVLGGERRPPLRPFAPRGSR